MKASHLSVKASTFPAVTQSMSSSAEIHWQGVRDNSSVSHLPGLALRAQFETSCPGHRLSLLPVDTKLMISWLSLDCGCRTSCHPIKAFSIMVDVSSPLLSPVFRDEDGAPRELIGHGALQAENKLSGASCQERLIILSAGGTHFHYVSTTSVPVPGWTLTYGRKQGRAAISWAMRRNRKKMLWIWSSLVKGLSGQTKPSVGPSLSRWAKQDGSACQGKLPCLYFYCIRDIHALRKWGSHRMLCDKRKIYSAGTYTVLLTLKEITKWKRWEPLRLDVGQWRDALEKKKKKRYSYRQLLNTHVHLGNKQFIYKKVMGNKLLYYKNINIICYINIKY